MSLSPFILVTHLPNNHSHHKNKTLNLGCAHATCHTGPWWPVERLWSRTTNTNYLISSIRWRWRSSKTLTIVIHNHIVNSFLKQHFPFWYWDFTGNFIRNSILSNLYARDASCRKGQMWAVLRVKTTSACGRHDGAIAGEPVGPYVVQWHVVLTAAAGCGRSNLETIPNLTISSSQ